MTAREELAAVLHDADCGCDLFTGGDEDEYYERLADALLASPALASLIREKQAEAWDEATDYDMARAVVRHCEDRGGYIGNPYRDQTEEPT